MTSLEASTAVSTGAQRRYRMMGAVTIAAVYFLIFVGGVVRASGAGMGCPDWPKCFGRWVPPTDVSQLPANYQEIYAERGYKDTAFNVVKTWTEYVNRLIGASIGLIIFATFICSLAFWNADRPIVWLSLLSFFLVGFNGWLGKVVVSSNLTPVIITGHMVAALLLVGVLIYAVARSRRSIAHYGTLRPGTRLNWLIAIVLAMSFFQLVLGTQVREHVDELSKVMPRPLWPTKFGTDFLIHRTFSIAILAGNIALARAIARNTVERGTLRGAANLLVALIGMEVLVGALLYYAGMPAVLQPVHLLLSSLMFGLQFYILIAFVHGRTRTNTDEHGPLETSKP